jgi:hypothetical protein
MKSWRSPALPALCVSFLALQSPAQERTDTSGIRRELDELKATVERQARELETLRERQAEAFGRSNALPPLGGVPEYLQGGAERVGATPAGEGTASRLAERIKIGGEVVTEIYDRNAERGLPASLGGPDDGNSQFMIRRFDLNIGAELIEDLVFDSTLRLDPVVRDQDEGSVDIQEAYLQFGNFSRHLFGFEDPSHTHLRFGNFYRWQKKFFDRRTEARSLAETSFWHDPITGIELGGTFDFGFFYSATLSNGNSLGLRDAGAGGRMGTFFNAPLGAQAIIQDQEQLGDNNNNKEYEVAVGFKKRSDDSRFGFTGGAFYREGRLALSDQLLLVSIPGSMIDGTRQSDRLGFVGEVDFDTQVMAFGLRGDVVWADDANLERSAFGLEPFVHFKFEGAYYQNRKFFTGLELVYRFAQLHHSGGALNPTTLAGLPFVDRDMHTLAANLEVTRNVTMRTEVSLFNENGVNPSNTEWLMQWIFRF